MKRGLLVLLVVLMVLGTGAMAAIDFTGWKQVTVDESSINSSSSTVYTVMIPPGTTEKTKDSSIGPTTFITNNTGSLPTYAIYVMDNPIRQKLSTGNAKDFLDNFMVGAGITPLAADPIVVSDGVVMYGTMENNTAGVYVLSTDEKVSIIVGFYSSMGDATAGIDNLAMIAGTVSITPTK